MQAPRTRQFVVDHTVVSAAIFGLLVSSVTLVLTLAATGNLSDIRQGSTEAEAIQAPNIPYDRQAIGAGEGWVGSGAVVQEQAQVPSVQLDRADRIAGLRAALGSETLSLSDVRDLEINAGAGMMKSKPATSSILENWEYMEQNPSLFTASKAASASGVLEGWEFWEQNPDVFAPSKEVTPGPGEGLNDYRFIEENTHLPGQQSSVSDPYQNILERGY